MQVQYLHIDSTPSTNDFLAEMLKTENLQTGFVVACNFQTGGKGQAGNKWEAERGKNLIFSILFRPKNLTVNKNFILAQATSLAIKSVLDEYLTNNSCEKFKIKWSNDIYWQQKKICGILIENTLKGEKIEHSIIGIGLNVNQLYFSKTIPNPISLCQITGKQYDSLNEILEKICQKILTFLNDTNNYPNIKLQYFNALERNDGFYDFRTNENFTFSAKIVEVKDDGKLILQTPEGDRCGFYFKEIIFV